MTQCSRNMAHSCLLLADKVLIRRIYHIVFDTCKKKRTQQETCAHATQNGASNVLTATRERERFSINFAMLLMMMMIMVIAFFAGLTLQRLFMDVGVFFFFGFFFFFVFFKRRRLDV